MQDNNQLHSLPNTLISQLLRKKEDNITLIISMMKIAYVTSKIQGAQLAPNAKVQAWANPAEPFATSAWEPHVIKKTKKYISA